MSDIIAACSTPPGKGAIAVIRLSGKGCVELASRLFSPMPDAPGKTRVGYFPRSFSKTGQCAYTIPPHVRSPGKTWRNFMCTAVSPL